MGTNEVKISSVNDVDPSWKAFAYPLHQVVIHLQGTRNSRRESIVNQLEEVLTRLRAGEDTGESHDDDFGYRFAVVRSSDGPSFFDKPASSI